MHGKSLCNNLEVIKMMNTFGHGINYNLIREIETEHALIAINQQVDKRVVIPDEENLKLEDNKIALMVADNIDNLESTITGLGTSNRVNLILVKKGIKSEHGEVTSEEAPAKKKCSQSLPSDQVMKDVPDYYHGKRIGPGELKYLTNLDKSDEYGKYSIEQKMNFLIWIALRCITMPPILLVPGWTGFNIVLRKNVVVLESKISYLDTLDSPATDIKTAYEVLCRACAIKECLGLESVLCVLDQAFYAKAAEVIWKNKDIFGDIVIMLGGFHLLMMFLGVMGIRYGDSELWDIAVQSDIIAEGSIKKVLQGKHYNRAVHTHKIVYEALS